MIQPKRIFLNFEELENSTINFKDLSPEEMQKIITNYMELQQIYGSAIQEINTKLEILDSEFQVKYEHNPIHHIVSRLKSPKSMLEKLVKKGCQPNFKSAMDNLFDIAGIRVICNYIEDVYTIADLLTRQSDITLLKAKDYIKNPKPNGYRSLHIIVTVPVFLSEGPRNIPVEIQIRTIAMDYWASLEHELKYKSMSAMEESLKEQLYDCAGGIAAIEQTMQHIHQKVHAPVKDAESLFKL